MTTYKPDGFDILVAVVNFPLAIAVRLWTFVTLWGWFIVPLGGIPLTMYQGFGVLLVWSVLTFKLAREKIDMKEAADYYAVQIAPHLGCGLLLVVGVLARGMFAQ